MKISEVVTRLDHNLEFRESRYLGERCFSMYFGDWLNKLLVPADSKYNEVDIDSYLPQLAIDAWEDMRTGITAKCFDYRREYKFVTGRSMVPFMDLEDKGVEQSSALLIISNVLQALDPDKRITYQFDSYCNAQTHVIKGLFDKFLRQVYRRGLFEIVKTDARQAVCGTFGSTKLATYVIGERMLVIFSREKKKSPKIEVSFFLRDNDPLGLDARLSTAYAKLPTAMNMIEEVIALWPRDRVTQTKKVGLWTSLPVSQ